MFLSSPDSLRFSPSILLFLSHTHSSRPVEAQGKHHARTEVLKKLHIGFAVQVLRNLMQSEMGGGHVCLLQLATLIM